MSVTANPERTNDPGDPTPVVVPPVPEVDTDTPGPEVPAEVSQDDADVPDDDAQDAPTASATDAVDAVDAASAGPDARPDTSSEPEPEPAPAAATPTPRGRLWEALKPSWSRSQLLAGVLCALLGFALVAQVRHSGQDELATMRQDDLVRLLDDVTNRSEQLEAEVSRLQASRDELVSGTDSARAALELAEARAAAEGILSGRLPAEGPGVRFTIYDPQGKLVAANLVNLLEELRNAGTEVAQVNDIRIVASSAFVGTSRGIQLDGHLLESPLEWVVIGDPATIDRALEIPNGALPQIRAAGATTGETEQLEHVSIDATVELREPRFVRPLDREDD